jgi:hypothetical protein
MPVSLANDIRSEAIAFERLRNNPDWLLLRGRIEKRFEMELSKLLSLKTETALRAHQGAAKALKDILNLVDGKVEQNGN